MIFAHGGALGVMIEVAVILVPLLVIYLLMRRARRQEPEGEPAEERRLWKGGA